MSAGGDRCRHGGGPTTFTITGGADAALFEIAGGNLVFIAAPRLRDPGAQLRGPGDGQRRHQHHAKKLTVTSPTRTTTRR